jgi:enamine deaminase RidA (YjgF/YER057c/UK114 family)
MPDNVRFSNPDTMQKPPGYSHVVEVTGPGRTVYFAGQLGIDKSGKMGANAREQMEIAFENVKAALDSVGQTSIMSSSSTTISSTSEQTSRTTVRYVTST